MDVNRIRLILKVTLGVLITTAIVCAWRVYSINKEYSDSIAEYEQLNTMVKVEEKVEKDVPSKDETTDTVAAPVEEKSEIDISFDMDYPALKAINDELIGWILYQPLEISYPVVLAHADDYYETHSFEKVKNRAGAISLDIACKADLTSFNSIIYGHNMMNNSMFGRLKEIMEDYSIIERDPYVYIFTENEALKYKLFAAYYTVTGTATYEVELTPTKEDIKNYIDYINEVADYKDEEFFQQEISDDIKICTLSTCHGHRTNKRTVLHGVLVAREPRK